MTAGTVQEVLICAAVPANEQLRSVDQDVCPVVGGVQYQLRTQQAYVLAPESAGYIDSITRSFDYETAAGFWGFAFGSVLTLWLTAYGVGSVINVIRRNLY
ncbi:hypothetical protein [Caballeronia sp. AZ7_KS35]|uniref:hypothetical protein n=1 Tax=Caballeronia sp. AZ7_KS35 TaxID=2921762 RepID=UPI002028BCEF|nr:hypothetical protein [Caballeronia sp. AZ7_KS35]